MFNNKNRFIHIVLSAVLTATAAITPVHATDNIEIAAIVEPGIEPQWENVYSATASITFSGSTLCASAHAYGQSGTTYDNGIVRIRKLTGENSGSVKTWEDLSSKNSYFNFYDDTLTATSGTYRIDFAVDATRNGITETITAYKEVTY